GLDFERGTFLKLMEIDREAGKAEAREQADHFKQFGDHLPKEMELQRELLVERLGRAPEIWSLE
ncbi:MAG: phosphoenolpyruvate carboxykinase, partial [Rhodospirillaceae bacterium]|nr:phosphoenolpyruvate carboxykinase [Rhodospirillaceae bacterium]